MAGCSIARAKTGFSGILQELRTPLAGWRGGLGLAFAVCSSLSLGNNGGRDVEFVTQSAELF